MSQENVELVRQVYDAAARRDTPAVHALYDESVELDNSGLGLVGGGVYRGHDGLRRFFREWQEAWDHVEYDYDALIDAGEYVISLVTRQGQGRASGIAVEMPLALVWTIRDGKVVRVVWYHTRDDALEAIRVAE